MHMTCMHACMLACMHYIMHKNHDSSHDHVFHLFHAGPITSSTSSTAGTVGPITSSTSAVVIKSISIPDVTSSFSESSSTLMIHPSLEPHSTDSIIKGIHWLFQWRDTNTMQLNLIL